MPNPVNYYIQTDVATLPVNSTWGEYTVSTAIKMNIYGNEGYAVSASDFTISGLPPTYEGPSIVEDFTETVNVNLAGENG